MMDEDYNLWDNTYKGVRVPDIMIMFEICVKQGVDFNNPKTREYTAGFQAGVNYMQREQEEALKKQVKDLQFAQKLNEQDQELSQSLREEGLVL